MDNFPLERVRSDTPALARNIFMNSAGASLRPAQVTAVVKDYLDLEDSVGGHEAARIKANELAQVYISIAAMTGAGPTEIALMENNTIAWHTVLSALDLGRDDEIIVSQAEYISGLAALMELRSRKGVRVQIVEYDSEGFLDLEHLKKLLSPRTKLVCLTHISTSNGTVQPVQEAGRIIRQNSDAFFLLDACQSVGQYNIDVKEIGCHALTATGRKYIRGPRGTGILYVEADIQKKLRPQFPDGSRVVLSDAGDISLCEGARQYETYEKSLANIMGLGRAVDYALDIGVGQIQARIAHISKYLRTRIAKIEDLEIGESAHQSSGIVTFTSNKTPLADIYTRLNRGKIVLKHIYQADGAWDFAAKQQKGALRLSVHYFNTIEECDVVAELLAQIVRK